ncbi:hypothetical protein [Ekhidna sp. To15]|uniref:hypothetical protein n=1 Tax=Ekhidna sp. To15 TaxID=3395267 RepID=UPI003F51EDC0
MSYKLFVLSLLFCCLVISANGQKIVVDSASTNKYLIRPPEKEIPSTTAKEEITFSDRALSIGKGILNRLKARLNLEEAAESIKDKKDKILGKEEDQVSEEKKEGDG